MCLVYNENIEIKHLGKNGLHLIQEGLLNCMKENNDSDIFLILKYQLMKRVIQKQTAMILVTVILSLRYHNVGKIMLPSRHRTYIERT